ncbi:MAG TPA: ADP-ribosylglycohydrolase family protein [Methanocorpusculum sp.]|nr:ADP-ribosylglycohydrolase family protein [Methanocorpusculum sp.]
MTPESQEMRQLRSMGCMLGAVLGDALAMPYETLSARNPEPLAFGKPYRGHPHDMLMPGQYTDDGQIILMAARTFAETQDGFDKTLYARELLRTNNLRKFRYADGAVISACRKMESSGNLLGSGICSDTAGCIGLAIPFAIAYSDRKEMAKALADACTVTHTSPEAIAGTIALALMLNTLIETGDLAKGFAALDTAAQNMFPELAVRITHAYRAADDRMPIATAAAQMGTGSQTVQLLPLAAYLCRSFGSPEQLLSAAISCGGNCGTLAMICGAVSGARYGINALPLGLVRGVERAGIFEDLAKKLCIRAVPEKKEASEDDSPDKKPEEGQA